MASLARTSAALLIWIANLVLWHVPALYQGALSSEPLHALEHASFLSAGVLMWMAPFRPAPEAGVARCNPARLGYVIAVRFGGAALGNAFMWAGTVFYPDYRAGEASWTSSRSPTREPRAS